MSKKAALKNVCLAAAAQQNTNSSSVMVLVSTKIHFSLNIRLRFVFYQYNVIVAGGQYCGSFVGGLSLDNLGNRAAALSEQARLRVQDAVI